MTTTKFESVTILAFNNMTFNKQSMISQTILSTNNHFFLYYRPTGKKQQF